MSKSPAKQLLDRLYKATIDVKSKKRSLNNYLARHESERTEQGAKVRADNVARAEQEVETLRAQVIAWKQ